MPSLDTLIDGGVVKMLLMGDSGSGKTGSLASLVLAGYKLRILDFDSGLPVLAMMVRKHDPSLLTNIEYRTLDDKFKPSAAGLTVQPYAFVEALKMLTNWKYGDVDMGHPYQWGPGYILVIDSLTFLSHAAYNWADALNPNVKDKRQVYGVAQGGVEDMLAQLKSETFNTNVIVVSHVKYIEREDGTTKGYPTSIGSALSPNIPTYFNSAVKTLTKVGGKRTIQTQSSALIDLKNPAAFGEELPLETGLATFFETLRGPCPTNSPQTSISQTSNEPTAISISSQPSPAPTPTLTVPSFPKGKLPVKALRGS